MTIDTSSWQCRLVCRQRYKDRVEDLRRAGSRSERVAIFERIAQEVNIHEARTCWNAAFPKKKEAKK